MTISTRRPRAGNLVNWIALPAAILISGATIGTASYAAFSATTATPTSNWAAGTVALSDDDSATALFTASNLAPGSTGTRCIAVTSTGSLASAVRLYGTGATTTNALSSNITLVVTQGTGGSFAGGCTGFVPLVTGSAIYTGSLADFGTTATNYATGLGSWAPTGTAPETRVFRFVYTLDAAAPNTTQGGTAALGFTWEAQNS
ncbi:MAG TPA: hypothetical protein VNS80_03345 [Pseudolysinimonas sp.]|nr:hypothetical protein [Pseudolysinimonas sp.]